MVKELCVKVVCVKDVMSRVVCDKVVCERGVCKRIVCDNVVCVKKELCVVPSAPPEPAHSVSATPATQSEHPVP